MVNRTKADISILVLIILVFLYPLVLMRQGFLRGDSYLQFYPWFKVYADSIKNLHFPFWTRYIQSGFPLMGEGQIGGYYPVNFTFFYLLPFNFAYNYSIVFHFFVGGIATYFLSKKIGACGHGAVLSSLIFCFGSAFSGCFYNIISLRTLSWTPLVFLLLENYFDKGKLKLILLAGFIFGLQLLAGFVQLAFYSGVFYSMYFLYKIRLSIDKSYFHLVALLVFNMLAGLLFLPQFVISRTVVAYSSRVAADLQFALWKSFNPVGILGLIFPYWTRIFAPDLYFSIAGILFLISSFYLLRQNIRIRPLFLILIISSLCALGRYIPFFYPVLIKMTGLYGLRNPSKFIFFTALSSSVLIGAGFSAFFESKNFPREKAAKVFSLFLLLSCAVISIVKIGLVLFREKILQIGKWYVEKYIYGNSWHKYDLDVYLTRVNHTLEAALEHSSFLNLFNMASLFFMVLALILTFITIKGYNETRFKYYKKIFLVIIIVDLFIYSFIRIINNIILAFADSRFNKLHKPRRRYIKMDKQKERRRLLEGIEEEIIKLEKEKDKLPDYENRVAELKKEANKLRKELGIN